MAPSSKEIQAIGHDVSYVRRIDGQWEQYDDLQTKFRVVDAQKIVSNIKWIVYTI